MLGTQGKKYIVMTLAQFKKHPDRAIIQGQPVLYSDKSWNIRYVILKEKEAKDGN